MLHKKSAHNFSGFTLIELLITIVIISSSLVAIFQALLISLDRIQHLTRRMHATIILDNRLVQIENTLRIYKSLPFELNHTETVDTGGQIVQYKQAMSLRSLEDYVDTFRLDLKLTWDEAGKTKSLSRAGFITDFNYYHQN